MRYNSDYQTVTPNVVNQFFVDNYWGLKYRLVLQGVYNDQIFNQIANLFCQFNPKL
jgi:hypothetical protein